MISSSKAPTAGLVGAATLLEHPKPLVTRIIGIALVMKVLDLFQGTEAIKGAVVGIHRVPSTLLWQLWRASNQRICQMLKMPDHPFCCYLYKTWRRRVCQQRKQYIQGLHWPLLYDPKVWKEARMFLFKLPLLTEIMSVETH